MRFVKDNQADRAVKRMCELVEVPRSSVYEFVNHQPTDGRRVLQHVTRLVEATDEAGQIGERTQHIVEMRTPLCRPEA